MPKAPEKKHLDLQATNSSLTVARLPANKRTEQRRHESGKRDFGIVVRRHWRDKSEGSEEDKEERDATVVTATFDPDIGPALTSAGIVPCRAT